MTVDGNKLAPSDVVSYWFSEEVRPKWFEPDDAFDAGLRSRFGPAAEKAQAGGLASWAETPEGALALVILLDQVPRNIHRGKAEAFAADAQALRVAKEAISRKLDATLEAAQRQFLYLPFMHSERLEDQEQGMALYAKLGLEEPLDFMQQHRDIIARFGRFPHRNETLGRTSTAEELEFLKQPGSRF